MKRDANMMEADVQFIRLFFPSPLEEEVAVQIAGLLASVVGEQIKHLRPDTRLSEIFRWADSLGTAEIVMLLEELFGHEIDDNFAADFDQQTFRGLVEYASCRNRAA